MHHPLGSDSPVRVDWSLAQRIVFRFVCIYLVLYSLPWPLGWIPGTGSLAADFEVDNDRLLEWFGTNVLGIASAKLQQFPTGSGDTTRSFVTLQMQAAMALAATVLWSLFDRRRAHPRLADLLRTYVRYVLAAAMLGYGTAKWFDGQFRQIDVASLLTTWGDSSPMGVLWKFMGASPAYTWFSGFVECLGGVLLLWRRTATLGAMVAAGAMTNVVLLNFCYDVPVKLYSLHLLAMAIVVMLRDAPRLAAVLVWNRPVAAVPLRLPSPTWAFWLGRIVKFAAVCWLLIGSGVGVYNRAKGVSEPVSPLAGGYEVVEFVRDGEVVPPLLTDATRWRYAIFRYGRLVVVMTDGKTQDFFAPTVAADGRTVKLARIRGPASDDARPDPELAFHFEDPAVPTVPLAASPVEAAAKSSAGAAAVNAIAPPPGGPPAATPAASAAKTLVFEGPFDGAAVRIRLREVVPETFLLRKRGFRWIQEYPFNR